MADAGIAVWDAKFHYRFWRPFSAIPLADTDGNPPTVADPAWTPLLATPNHQEYPSGHGGLSGAAARVLARIFGDKTGFTHRTDTAPFAPRTHQLLLAADEANNSRVYGGIHFRTAVRDGRTIGDRVGRLLETLMRPSYVTRRRSGRQSRQALVIGTEVVPARRAVGRRPFGRGGDLVSRAADSRAHLRVPRGRFHNTKRRRWTMRRRRAAAGPRCGPRVTSGTRPSAAPSCLMTGLRNITWFGSGSPSRM